MWISRFSTVHTMQKKVTSKVLRKSSVFLEINCLQRSVRIFYVKSILAKKYNGEIKHLYWLIIVFMLQIVAMKKTHTFWQKFRESNVYMKKELISRNIFTYCERSWSSTYKVYFAAFGICCPECWPSTLWSAKIFYLKSIL